MVELLRLMISVDSVLTSRARLQLVVAVTVISHSFSRVAVRLDWVAYRDILGLLETFAQLQVGLSVLLSNLVMVEGLVGRSRISDLRMPAVAVPPRCCADAHDQHVASMTATGVLLLWTFMSGYWLLWRIAHREVHGRLYRRELGQLVCRTLRLPCFS